MSTLAHRENRRKNYWIRKRAGLCPKCGLRKPMPDKWACTVCYERTKQNKIKKIKK